MNIIFNLFDKLEITFKEIKTHLNASKQHEFDVMIYHMQNDHDNLLDHIIKENQQKIEFILFLSKLFTDAEIQY